MSIDSRLTIVLFGLGILLIGGGLYGGLKAIGISDSVAQGWVSALLLLGFAGWTAGYLRRVLTGQMSYHQQQQTYETERLKQRVDQMTSDELAALHAEIEADVD